MPGPDERPIDESQDLADDPDDRDRGYGFVVEGGEVVQLEPDEDGSGED